MRNFLSNVSNAMSMGISLKIVSIMKMHRKKLMKKRINGSKLKKREQTIRHVQHKN
jgi:hypothetical protein